jgi:hypothetical protein
MPEQEREGEVFSYRLRRGHRQHLDEALVDARDGTGLRFAWRLQTGRLRPGLTSGASRLRSPRRRHFLARGLRRLDDGGLAARQAGQ